MSGRGLKDREQWPQALRRARRPGRDWSLRESERLGEPDRETLPARERERLLHPHRLVARARRRVGELVLDGRLPAAAGQRHGRGAQRPPYHHTAIGLGTISTRTKGQLCRTRAARPPLTLSRPLREKDVARGWHSHHCGVVGFYGLSPRHVQHSIIGIEKAAPG
jgi:hypothetical protein